MIQNPIVKLADSIENKQPAVLATIIEVEGASPAKVGAQIVLLSDGKTVGTVGGGKLESSVLSDAQVVRNEGQPRLIHYSLKEEGLQAIGTLCGGEVAVFIQPFLPPAQLIILGGGHIGQPLKIMGDLAGFDSMLVDVEPGLADIPELGAIKLTPDSFVVLITTDHISDEAALRQVIISPARYIGMIGSRHKCQTIIDHLRKDGFNPDAFDRVYAPIGLDLGGPSPEEIAVAILAEVIAVRWGGKGSSRSR